MSFLFGDDALELSQGHAPHHWGNSCGQKPWRILSVPDGGDAVLQVILKSEPVHPFGLAVYGEHIFWTDWVRRAVQRANKYVGSDMKLLRVDIPQQPMGIIAVANDTNSCEWAPAPIFAFLLTVTHRDMHTLILHTDAVCTSQESHIYYPTHHINTKQHIQPHYRLTLLNYSSLKTPASKLFLFLTPQMGFMLPWMSQHMIYLPITQILVIYSTLASHSACFTSAYIGHVLSCQAG